MGESSPKSMRGAGMDDVIFAGTAIRPARDFAEVSLLVERAAADVPGDTQYASEGEVEVTRRIERGAGSAYRVNGRDVRAKDVALLFADAATGAHSPALVSQGKISAVIAAKPVERRHDARGSGRHFRPSRPPQGCRTEASRRRDQSRPARRTARRHGAREAALAPPGQGRRALPQAVRPDPRRRRAADLRALARGRRTPPRRRRRIPSARSPRSSRRARRSAPPPPTSPRPRRRSPTSAPPRSPRATPPPRSAIASPRSRPSATRSSGASASWPTAAPRSPPTARARPPWATTRPPRSPGSTTKPKAIAARLAEAEAARGTIDIRTVEQEDAGARGRGRSGQGARAAGGRAGRGARRAGGARRRPRQAGPRRNRGRAARTSRWPSLATRRPWSRRAAPRAPASEAAEAALTAAAQAIAAAEAQREQAAAARDACRKRGRVGPRRARRAPVRSQGAGQGGRGRERRPGDQPDQGRTGIRARARRRSGRRSRRRTGGRRAPPLGRRAGASPATRLCRRARCRSPTMSRRPPLCAAGSRRSAWSMPTTAASRSRSASGWSRATGVCAAGTASSRPASAPPPPNG